MSDSTTAADAVVIERIFNAPVALIWQMWTQPEHFKQWYGPQGFTVPVAEMDVRVGGKRLICMASPDGSMKMWTTGEFVEIVPNERLVYTESPADENGQVTPPDALPPGFPALTEVTVLLAAVDGGTKMVMTQAGISAASGAGEGWNQAFTKLAAYIETAQ